MRHLTEVGVDQFLDLGSGIPTVGNVHEVAQAANPDARVVYVDHDPVAVTHSRELRRRQAADGVLDADFLDAEQVLDLAVADGGLDLDRPVAVLAVAVLHFVPDDRGPAETMAALHERAGPGQPPRDQPRALRRRARGRGRASSSTGRSAPCRSDASAQHRRDRRRCSAT